MGLDLFVGRPMTDPAKREEWFRDNNEYPDPDTVLWDYSWPEDHVAGLGYLTFMVIRERVAHIDGINLESMPGFRDEQSLGFKYHRGYTPPQRTWEEAASELEPFLHHPDESGELSPEECAQVVDRLDRIAQAMREGDDFRTKLEKIVAGMRRCVEQNEYLLFR